ncbi:GLPGLI family protein [Bacteroides oleiciplenus]|uniref:GLPGLI family protein n=1 Tax=Bacteroides oleiciplenus TaxID=626931 RepID=UPI0026DAD6A0|nr:GLPGLI family protein [Bacteroides oleiciplenus]
MKVKYILFFICSVITHILYAQKVEIIEPAVLECEYYKRVVTDTLDRKNDYKAEPAKLRIGKNSSMFYSPRELRWDSLGTDKRNQAMMFIEYSRKTGGKSLRGVFNEYVYKNFPENKVTVFNHFALMDWTYEEEWEKPQWELKDSTKVILEYPCQLAISHYRGRVWYAWFTFDIPISEGPWKLCGLPGLILEAYDKNKDYSFIATDLVNKGIHPVGIYDFRGDDWAKTTRKKYLETRYKELHTDPTERMSTMYGLKRSEGKKELKHRNYDFEETDYH